MNIGVVSIRLEKFIQVTRPHWGIIRGLLQSLRSIAMAYTIKEVTANPRGLRLSDFRGRRSNLFNFSPNPHQRVSFKNILISVKMGKYLKY